VDRLHKEASDLVLPLLKKVSGGLRVSNTPWSAASGAARARVPSSPFAFPGVSASPPDVLLGQISSFRELQSIILEDQSVTYLTTQFLADLALQHGSTLRHLRIEGESLWVRKWEIRRSAQPGSLLLSLPKTCDLGHQSPAGC